MNVEDSAASIIGERILARRNSLGLSQEDVAHLAELNVSNYGKIERGLINPRLYTLIRIAAVLELDPANLVAHLTVDSIPKTTHKLTASDLIRARAGQT